MYRAPQARATGRRPPRGEPPLTSFYEERLSTVARTAGMLAPPPVLEGAMMKLGLLRRWLLLAVLGVSSAAAAEEEVAPQPPVRNTEVALTLGAWSASSAYQGGRSGALFATGDLEARYVFHLLALEAGLVTQLPFVPNGPGWGVSALARLGVSTGRFSVTAGALVSFAPSPAPAQVLPSLSAAVRLGPTVASLGLFDRFAAAPARLSLEWHELGLGWVFPLGGEAFGRIHVAPSWAVELRALAFSLYGSLTVIAVAGIVWSPEVTP